MPRFAILVDAGYFRAAALEMLATSPQGGRVRFRFGKRFDAIAGLARPFAEPASLLRLYWYDAAVGAKPTTWHESLADLPGIKLRLGHLRGTPPRQKGVDTLLVRDLIVLAEKRAVSDVVLFAGDEDLREGVAYAQELGVRVHLVIFEGVGSSRTLHQEADQMKQPRSRACFRNAAPNPVVA